MSPSHEIQKSNGRRQPSGHSRKRNRVILGNSVAIVLCPTSKHGPLVGVLIDKNDLEAVLSVGHWRARRYRESKTFYAITSNDNEHLAMHNVLLGAKGVDHINRRGSDNRRSNLRAATPAQNRANTGPFSGMFKGVTFHKACGKYQASLKHKGKFNYLGLFAAPEDAARAYDAKAKSLFGEFAYLNFPLECA